MPPPPCRPTRRRWLAATLGCVIGPTLRAQTWPSRPLRLIQPD